MLLHNPLRLLVLLGASCSLLAAQRIAIDWPSRQMTSCPSELSWQRSVPVVVRNINDILYTYEVSIDVKYAYPSDIDDIPPVFTTAAGCPPDIQAFAKRLEDVRDRAARLRAAFTENAALTPNLSGGKYASVKLGETLSAWSSFKEQPDYREFKKDLDELRKLPPALLTRFATGAPSNCVRLVREADPAIAEIDRIRQFFDDFDARTRRTHVWEGSADITPGADNTVTVNVSEAYDGVPTTDGSKTFTCQIKSAVLSLSVGPLFSRIPAREYQQVSVPKTGDNGQTLDQTYNALTVHNRSNFSPYGVGQLNFDLPVPRLSASTLGLTLTSGPTFRIGGAASNVSSFGYFGGLGIQVWKRLFITPGVHVGQIADFPVGYSENSAVPSSATFTPVKRWTTRFGISLSYRASSIAALGQRQSTPAPTEKEDEKSEAAAPKPSRAASSRAASNRASAGSAGSATEPNLGSSGFSSSTEVSPPASGTPAPGTHVPPAPNPPAANPPAPSNALPPTVAPRNPVRPAAGSSDTGRTNPTSGPATSGVTAVFGDLVRFDGGACPAHPAAPQAYTTSPDRKVLSVLFSDFAARSQEGELRSSCTFRIPVRIPANQRLHIRGVDLRGGAHLLAQESASVGVSAVIFGRSGSSQAKLGPSRFVGPHQTDFAVLVQGTGRNGTCGGHATVVIRIEAELSEFNSGDSMVQLDSLDLDLKNPAHAYLEPCKDAQ
jgi:hypothetical protein